MTRAFYDEDVDPHALDGETVAVLGYGIQGRAQALNLRDSGVRVIVGNRDDAYRRQARDDGFDVYEMIEAARRGTIVALLVPDEVQPRVFEQHVGPRLARKGALLFAHGFAVRYGLIRPPAGVDVLLLAPRMPGRYVRKRFLDGWGVPAFVAVEQDATGRAWPRVLGIARALGVTRCAAIASSFAEETELDHFSEHFLYPFVLRAIEIAFEELVRAGYPPEVAVMELHGSGELGEVLGAAATEGVGGMIRSHASPACQVGIAHHWERAIGPDPPVRERIRAMLEAIRSGEFAAHLLAEQRGGYPELDAWRAARAGALANAEHQLHELLRPNRSPAP